MEQFIKLTAKVTPVNLDNVDTDMIIPAQHLKSVSKEGFGEHLFSNLRQMYPDFILNQPAYTSGEVLISKSNFGCGSSREHAAWAIQQYGFKAVICSSFGDIFFNNAAKNAELEIIKADRRRLVFSPVKRLMSKETILIVSGYRGKNTWVN